jgi:putative ABC transporter type IV
MNYASAFLGFGVGGYLYERYLLGHTPQDTVLKKLGAHAPFLLIYAIGGVILEYVYVHFREHLTLGVVAVTVVLLAFLECVLGLGSYVLNGYHTWNYDQAGHMGTFCGGYASLTSMLVWFLGACLYFWFRSTL